MTNYVGLPAGFEDDDDDDYSCDDVDFICNLTQRLKVKVVPQITSGAGIHGSDFDCLLSETENSWFDDFRCNWNTYKNSPSVQQKFKLYLLQNRESLKLALKLFANCPECANLKKKDLAVFILQTTCDLYKTHPHIANDCDNNTRVVAFNFVRTCGVLQMYKAVIETFQLYIVIDYIMPKLREMLSQGHYKDVAYWALYLNIRHTFNIFEIVFPLILQDKVHIAEEYLDGVKDQQIEIVQFLDTLMDKQKTIAHYCDAVFDKYTYKDVKHDVLNYRHMSKLLSRFVTKYRIDSKLTPNLNFSKACSHMHYLYHKYQDGGMGLESWRELISDNANTPELQQHLVTHIATYDNIGEALFWLKQFKISVDDLPPHISIKLRECPSNDTRPIKATDVIDSPDSIPTSSKSTINSDEFLQLDLPEDSIIFVDTDPKFLDMIFYLRSHTHIAFDSEWKPSLAKDCRVSLLQLSTFERVYLVDCISSSITDGYWRMLGYEIFNNLEILKIGFSISQDISILNKSLPLYLNLRASSCYLDLRDMWVRLKYMQIVSFPYGNSLQTGGSLCALTELCLGKKLNKSNQCSNWTKRPLRQDQIVYAALDAYCLLKIYNVFSEVLQQLGLDINKVIDELTTSTTGYLYHVRQHTLVTQITKTSTNQQAIEEQKSSPVNDIIWANDIKFICDYMLSGLSKELRKLGIDCMDAKSSEFDYYIDIVNQDNRYMLTRNERYELFSSKLPKLRCFHIPSDSNLQQLLNVLNIFDIRVHQRHLFTRCLQCNGNEFIFVHKDDMRSICRRSNEYFVPSKGKQHIKQYIQTDKTYSLVNVTEHIINSKTTFRGKMIKFFRIKRHILESQKHFYICDNCGCCTWDGAHPLHTRISELIVNGV